MNYLAAFSPGGRQPDNERSVPPSPLLGTALSWRTWSGGGFEGAAVPARGPPTSRHGGLANRRFSGLLCPAPTQSRRCLLRGALRKRVSPTASRRPTHAGFPLSCLAGPPRRRREGLCTGQQQSVGQQRSRQPRRRLLLLLRLGAPRSAVHGAEPSPRLESSAQLRRAFTFWPGEGAAKSREVFNAGIVCDLFLPLLVWG